MPSLPYTTNLVDTPTGGAQSQGVGPTAALQGANDPYSVNQIRFPLEGLGQDDVPHYVVFNINLPTSSKYVTNSQVPLSNANVASVQNYDTLQSSGGNYNPVSSGANTGAAVTLAAIVTTAQSGFDSGVKAGITGVAGAGLLTTLDLRPKLVRIKQSIAIYMPETIATTYSHEWGSVSATEAGGNIGKYAQLGGSFKGALGEVKNALETVGKNLFSDDEPKSFNFAQEGELGAQLLTSAGTLGPGFTDLTLKSLGKAVNPHVEMLFKQTQNRQFEFVFHFVPRSQQEAVVVYNIIKTFKAYAAPEVSAEAGGRYFIPPGQFDISFYFKQAQNPTLAKISTCALTNIQVNYSGAGSWTTFNDGNPLKIDLSLTFLEMDIITRELITQYGY